MTSAIKRSARFELMQFLNIPTEDIGNGGTGKSNGEYDGMILPESRSNFQQGFKVVTFYVDANLLLRTSYVMRRDGWMDSNNLYQRMISKTKIGRIRAFLKSEKRVFINNVIVTLP